MNHWKLKGVWYSRKGIKQIKNLLHDDINSIAVIKHAALGDMVLTRSFLIHARHLFRNAKITLSVRSNYMRGIPEDLIDRLHIFEVNDKNKNSIAHLIRSCKNLGNHDLLFDLAVTSRSIWISKLNKAKLKVSFPYRVIYRYLFYDITIPRCDVNFEADNMLGLLKPFGLDINYPLNYDIPGEPITRKRPYVLYFTSASTPHKCWPAKNFVELIRLLSARLPDCDHLILRGIKDWESIDGIMKNLQQMNNVFQLVSISSVEDVTAYVKGAQLVISNDTGVRNIAIACNIPSIGIFFSTPSYRYLPQHPIHQAVYNNDCSIPSVQQVFEAANTLFTDKDIYIKK